MNRLATALNALCDTHSFHTGWSLIDLRTGESADRHGDVVVPSGSTRKVAILMAALAMVDAGELSLDQECRIDPRR